MSFSEILGRVLLEEGEESFLEFGAAENLGLRTEGKVSHRSEHTRGGAANYGAAVVEKFDGSGLVEDDGLAEGGKSLSAQAYSDGVQAARFMASWYLLRLLVIILSLQ